MAEYVDTQTHRDAVLKEPTTTLSIEEMEVWWKFVTENV